MLLKYKGKEYPIGQEMWDAINAHAIERNITLDEYIAEAFTKLRETENDNDKEKPLV